VSARFALVGFALLVFGCNHDKPSDAAATASAVVSAAPAPASTDGTAQIPTEEDYEEHATSAISTANAATELSQIEKEIGK
jgi:hypothetical protein